MKKFITTLIACLMLLASQAQVICDNAQAEPFPLFGFAFLLQDTQFEVSIDGTPVDTFVIPEGIYDGTEELQYPTISPALGNAIYSIEALQPLNEGWEIRVRSNDIPGGGLDALTDWSGQGGGGTPFDMQVTNDFDGNGNNIGNCLDPMPNYTVLDSCAIAIEVVGLNQTLDNTAVTYIYHNFDNELIYNLPGEFNDTLGIETGTTTQEIVYQDLLGNNGPAIYTVLFAGVTTVDTLMSGDFININGSIAQCNQSLPVEFMYFKSSTDNTVVNLEWATAAELNNDYFAIERLAENGEWEELAYVPGRGTTSAMNIYTWADDSPLKGDNYYRLKQVDYDGAFEYSNITTAYIESLNGYNLLNKITGEQLRYESYSDIPEFMPLYDIDRKQSIMIFRK